MKKLFMKISLNFIKNFVIKRLNDGSLIPFLIKNILWLIGKTEIEPKYIDQVKQGFCDFNELTDINSEAFFDYSEEKLA